jgi:hypothetical protein
MDKSGEPFGPRSRASPRAALRCLGLSASIAFALSGCARIEEEHIPLSMYGRADAQFSDKGPHVYYALQRGKLPLAYRKIRIWLGRRTTLEERYYYLDDRALEMMWKLSDDHYEVRLADGTTVSGSKARTVRSEADLRAKVLRPCLPSELRHDRRWDSYSGIVWCAWDGNKIGPAIAGETGTAGT